MSEQRKTLLERCKQSFEERKNNPKLRQQFLIDAGILNDNLEYVEYFKVPSVKEVLSMQYSEQDSIALALEEVLLMLDFEQKIKYLHEVHNYAKLECRKALKQANGSISEAMQLLHKMQQSKSIDKY